MIPGIVVGGTWQGRVPDNDNDGDCDGGDQVQDQDLQLTRRRVRHQRPADNTQSKRRRTSTLAKTPDVPPYTPDVPTYTPDVPPYTPGGHSYTPGGVSYTPGGHDRQGCKVTDILLPHQTHHHFPHRRPLKGGRRQIRSEKPCLLQNDDNDYHYDDNGDEVKPGEIPNNIGSIEEINEQLIDHPNPERDARRTYNIHEVYSTTPEPLDRDDDDDFDNHQKGCHKMTYKEKLSAFR